MEPKARITRVIPVDVSSANFEDNKGFHIRSGSGNIRYAILGGAKANVAARAVASNVATIETVGAHGLRVGETVVVSGMTDNTYDGAYTVVSTPTANTFTYALTHADEAKTTDSAGLVEAALIKTVAAQVYFVDLELVRKIFTLGTTATGIHVGYALEK